MASGWIDEPCDGTTVGDCIARILARVNELDATFSVTTALEMMAVYDREDLVTRVTQAAGRCLAHPPSYYDVYGAWVSKAAHTLHVEAAIGAVDAPTPGTIGSGAGQDWALGLGELEHVGDTGDPDDSAQPNVSDVTPVDKMRIRVKGRTAKKVPVKIDVELGLDMTMIETADVRLKKIQEAMARAGIEPWPPDTN